MENRKVLLMDLSIHLPYSSSLKDKRQIKRSLIQRLKNRFNISIIESDAQEESRILILSLAYVALTYYQAELTKEKIINDVYDVIDFVNGQIDNEVSEIL